MHLVLFPCARTLWRLSAGAAMAGLLAGCHLGESPDDTHPHAAAPPVPTVAQAAPQHPA